MYTDRVASNWIFNSYRTTNRVGVNLTTTAIFLYLFKEQIGNKMFKIIESVLSFFNKTKQRSESVSNIDYDKLLTSFQKMTKPNPTIRVQVGPIDPFHIICGYSLTENEIFYDGGGPFIAGTSTWISEEQTKGLIESLWDTFGGTINSEGLKVLNSKIETIYGDPTILSTQSKILKRLKEKGFASSNIVYR